MHINDGGKTYWPSNFNQRYELPRVSHHHLDHLYQPENTGGMDTGMQCVDDGGQGQWPSQFNERYELPRSSPMRPPQHLENPNQLDQLDQRQFNQHYELPMFSPMRPPHHLEHPDQLDQLDQLDQ